MPKEDQIVDHIPFNLPPILAFARVTGNQGAGYGLEIRCVYELYGPKPYIDKLREPLKSSGLV